MIELLGVGVARRGGGWLLRRVCAEIEAPSLTVVVSADPDERRAVLDVVGARVVPEEGRAWIDRAPLMRETQHRLRARVVEFDFAVWRGDRLSAVRSALRGRDHHGGIPRYVLVRALDASADRAASARALRHVVETEPVAVLVSVAPGDPLLAVADRILALAAGSVVFNGPPAPQRSLALH